MPPLYYQVGVKIQVLHLVSVDILGWGKHLIPAVGRWNFRLPQASTDTTLAGGEGLDASLPLPTWPPLILKDRVALSLLVVKVLTLPLTFSNIVLVGRGKGFITAQLG